MLTRENLTNKKGLQLENILFKSKNVKQITIYINNNKKIIINYQKYIESKEGMNLYKKCQQSFNSQP